MARKILAPVLLALVLLLGTFLFAPATPTATATPDLTDSPAVAEGEAQGSPAVSANGLDAEGRYVGDGADDDSLAGDGDAVPGESEGEQGAVRSDSEAGADGTTEAGADADADGAVPATDTDQDGTVPAEDDQDGTDPDALPADAPRVCVILDMGAAACESFVHPAPGEVSVAVIYSDDDEHAIVETIAYDEHGPIDYVDFWEGETTPSE